MGKGAEDHDVGLHGGWFAGDVLGCDGLGFGGMGFLTCRVVNDENAVAEGAALAGIVVSSRKTSKAATANSRVVAEVELRRMGIQIGLSRQVWLVVFAHVVPEERDRNHEGDQSGPELLNDFEKLLLLVTGQSRLEERQHVQQDIGVLLHSGPEPQGFQEQDFVACKLLPA